MSEAIEAMARVICRANHTADPGSAAQCPNCEGTSAAECTAAEGWRVEAYWAWKLALVKLGELLVFTSYEATPNDFLDESRRKILSEET